MPVPTPEREPRLYLMCDHLDAGLAMGEDLLTLKVALAHGAIASRDMDRVLQQNRELTQFLSEVRTLELSLIARLLQARKWAQELRKQELRLKPIIQLFGAVTGPLVDAAAELGDTTSQSFATGDTAIAYLRSRGLIERDEAGLERRPELAVTEEFLVAGRARLGTLLDLVATFLDTLDLLGDLYVSHEPAAAPLPTDAEAQAGAGAAGTT